MSSEATIDTVRPTTWDDFIGQDAMKQTLGIHLEAARRTDTPLPHLLLKGRPGFGKTTLASIIKNTLGDDMVHVVMPINKDRLTDILMELNGILFLDEIHRASKGDQEDLLHLMEFAEYTAPSGMVIPCTFLTIIGATTREDLLDDAFKTRFTIQPFFTEYTEEEMGEIVKGMASRIKDVGLEFSDEDAQALGKATGGVPRNGRHLIMAARALALTLDRMPTVDEVLAQAQVDRDGLSGEHYKYLEALKRFKGKAGLDRMTEVLSLSKSTVQEIEKQLYNGNFINYTTNGRALTATGQGKVTPTTQARRRTPRVSTPET